MATAASKSSAESTLPTNLPPDAPIQSDHEANRKPTNTGSAPSYVPGYVMNNRYDYEQKYPPDKQYEEMSPTSRLWKTYEDEAGKYNLERVADWRDGLDILLVFAALFSAVKSRIQHAILDALQNHAVQAIPPVAVSPFAFRSKLLDLWVNALWFTSLGLSLTTTLIVVLAKQWIHQYLAIPSGTPLDQSRIRHYRFSALQRWHVSLIIGCLPILMHLLLGLFFAGLMIYLCSLSIAIAVDMGCIACAAYGMYFLCNLLPLFYPDCPYKTPLLSYGYQLLNSLRRHRHNLVSRFRANPPSLDSIPESLKEYEHDAVTKSAPAVDSSAIVWLYNTTSNTSVQSIVLQALSSLPLEMIPVVGDATLGIKYILTAINSYHSVELPVDINKRLQRAATRFCGWWTLLPNKYKLPLRTPRMPTTTVTNNTYSFHRIDPLSSIKAIEHNLLDSLQDSPSWPRCDVLLWGKLFENALRLGVGWLGISHDVPSRLWCTLLRNIVFPHLCSRSDCYVNESSPSCELYTFWMPPTTDWPNLVVNAYDIESNGTSTSLGKALSHNMRPSFVKWLLHVGFPHFKRSSEEHTKNLLEDIFLLLVMLQTSAIQHSSSLHAAWFGERHESLFRLILDVVRDYSVNSILDGTHQDANIDIATVIALQKVVRSEAFVRNDIILPEDKDTILEILFQGVTRRIDLYGSQSHDFSWLSPDVGQCILQVLFVSASAMDISEILVDMCHYLLSSLPYAPWNVATLKTIYSTLIERRWLEGITTTLTLASSNPQSSITDDDGSRDPLHIWTRRFTSFQASLYIDGLIVLEGEAPNLFKLAISNLCEATNLLTMCKMLLMGDLDAQARLWKLAALVNLPVMNRHIFTSYHILSGALSYQPTDRFIICFVTDHTPFHYRSRTHVGHTPNTWMTSYMPIPHGLPIVYTPPTLVVHMVVSHTTLGQGRGASLVETRMDKELQTQT
ncbi:hypothetical protein CPB85DRAFT_1436070 [Mucidula mucida]|nr:hypothetical protein CPB85DRAFT_1436070 [Mucidula mucida]